MADFTNEARAAAAKEALAGEKYQPYYEESIIDLVTDLLHLARKEEIEPDYILETAKMHFDAEVQEELDQAVIDRRGPTERGNPYETGNLVP